MKTLKKTKIQQKHLELLNDQSSDMTCLPSLHPVVIIHTNKISIPKHILFKLEGGIIDIIESLLPESGIIEESFIPPFIYR